MHIAILGFDVEGQAAYEYWNTAGNTITICDQNPDITIPKGAESQLGTDYLKGLDHFDVLSRTPGLHPKDIVAANTPEILAKVTTVTNEFMKACPTRNIIGVTGTKGKGTTSTLITKMLEAAGKRVYLGGNIGIAPLELLKNDIQPDDWVVLELSNFQLIDLQASPYIAICLMIVPEHLNWHADMQEYMAAKQSLFAHQSPEDITIYYADNENSKIVATPGKGKKLTYYAPPGAIIENDTIQIDGHDICKTSELKLLGQHNWQNACAAVTAVWQVTQDVAAMHSVLTTFSGLEHRLEFVREVAGIRYYNDSFAATPDAAMAALEAIDGLKVPIIGGFDRNLSIEHLAAALKQNETAIRKTIFVGASAERLADSARQAGFTNFIVSPARDMQNIVTTATEQAKSGDTVLLSPGFASFDMFKNFEDRGRQFKEVVNAL